LDNLENPGHGGNLFLALASDARYGYRQMRDSNFQRDRCAAAEHEVRAMTLNSRHWGWLVACGLLIVSAGSATAQTKVSGFNEREIEPTLHAFDKADNWTLHFRFKDPRIVTLDVPGRGKKIIWYMWYQVYNLTKEPRYFLPDFELKTHDYESVHPDEIMPAVQIAISKIEDPTGRVKIKNSVEINKEPIPVTNADSFPRTITGVAIWTDIYDRAPKTNRFSIFVSGLSDGWRKDPKDNIIRRKTLQLNFQRLGDDIQNDPNSIRWIDNPTWIYRAVGDNQGPAAPAPKKENVILEPIDEPVTAPREVRPMLPMPPLLDNRKRIP
jgi:hypothetical protein